VEERNFLTCLGMNPTDGWLVYVSARNIGLLLDDPLYILTFADHIHPDDAVMSTDASRDVKFCLISEDNTTWNIMFWNVLVHTYTPQTQI
jgi:hypothetical protein